MKVFWFSLGLILFVGCKEDKKEVLLSSSIQSSSSALAVSNGIMQKAEVNHWRQSPDTLALLAELQKLQKSLLSRDLNALNSYFTFPIHGETANNMWQASLGDEGSDESRAKTQSGLFTLADFTEHVDSLLRDPDHLKALSKLKIQQWGESIAEAQVRTGIHDSSSVNLTYNAKSSEIWMMFGGKYFVNEEEGWYDKSAWIFIFEIKDGKRLVFKDIQGAG